MMKFFENGICKLFGVQRPTDTSMHNGDIEQSAALDMEMSEAVVDWSERNGNRPALSQDHPSRNAIYEIESCISEPPDMGRPVAVSADVDVKMTKFRMDWSERKGNHQDLNQDSTENNKRGGKPSGNAIDVDEIQNSEPTAAEVRRDHGRYLSKKTYDLIKHDKSASCWSGIGYDTLVQKSPMGNTVLHIAALYGNDNCVDQVIQNVSFLLDEKNSNGDTALHVAARAAHTSTLKKLVVATLKRPELALEQILVKNNKGNTFFHEALLNGHKDVMKILDCQEFHTQAWFKLVLPRCALFWTNKEEKSVFHIAIEKGYVDMVKDALTTLISDNDALTTWSSYQDLYGLILKDIPQSLNTDKKIAGRHREWLQRNGSHQDLSQDSMTENHREPTQFIPYGPHYVPPGKFPLNLAIFKRDQDMLRIILMKKKEWIHTKDNEGRIALHYAASIGYLQGVEVLLDSCIGCNMERDNDGLFPLHLASAGGHVEVVKKLLEKCPDPREILDKYGRNIVHIAAKVGMLNVVRYILEDAEYGLVDMINDKDANGNTPLHLATSCCHSKIVHALTWDKRVELSSVNGKNQTALDVFMQLMQENPPLRQRLTWIALVSGGVKYAKRESHSINAPIPSKCAESVDKHQAPNMDLYKDRIGTLTLVSTLITTVTFAAGFTLPGGIRSDKPGQGMAVMLNQVWFKLFVFCITVSMYGSLSVTIILIWTQLGDISLALLAVKMARPLLGVSLATLSVAFMAGVHLVISDLSWLATVFLVLCVISILLLLLLYTILWLPSSSSNPVMRYISYYVCQFLLHG